MKKNILLVLASLFVFVSANAQVDFDKYSDTLILENGVAHKAEITITNNTDHDIELKWKKIFSTLHDVAPGASDNSNAWNLQFCECNTCFTNDFGPLTPGGACNSPLSFDPTLVNSQKWYLTADQNGQDYGNAVWVIEVNNLTDNIKDTLRYFVMHPDSTNDPFNPVSPNSINEVSYNATINAYPNPANDELSINYELTNVSSPILSVYSIVGAKLDAHQLIGLNGNLTISTIDLESGMYFFTIEENGQRFHTQKFNVVH